MARRVTPAQRRALIWLLKHDGTQKMSDLMMAGNVGAQTVHNLVYDRLIRAKYADVWGSGARPIETVSLTVAGRKLAEEQEQ